MTVTAVRQVRSLSSRTSSRPAVVDDPVESPVIAPRLGEQRPHQGPEVVSGRVPRPTGASTAVEPTRCLEPGAGGLGGRVVGAGSFVAIPDSALVLLDRSSAGLLHACALVDASERYVTAHLAALRCAAAVLAVRGQAKRGGPRSVWELLGRAAPELLDWCLYFSATAARRAAIEAGRAEEVRPEEADALLHAAESFHHVAEATLGLPQYPILPASIPECVGSSWGSHQPSVR